MNLSIEEKLNLTQTPICFFKEGIFLKLLNESFYIVQQHYLPNLKFQLKLIKKINQPVIIGGFPLRSIMDKFPNAEPTLFGYQQLGDYDLSGYNEWFANCCEGDDAFSKTEIAIAINPSVNTDAVIMTNKAKLLKPNHQITPSNHLTEQQRAFLQHWQPNLYPHSVEVAFINDLKMHFLAPKNS